MMCTYARTRVRPNIERLEEIGRARDTCESMMSNTAVHVPHSHTDTVCEPLRATRCIPAIDLGGGRAALELGLKGQRKERRCCLAHGLDDLGRDAWGWVRI
jgi:hypothetical protein